MVSELVNSKIGGIALERGSEVMAEGRRYVITDVLDFSHVQAQDPETGQHKRLSIPDLELCSNDGEGVILSGHDLAALPDLDWDVATSRQRIVTSLMSEERRRTRAEVEAVAREIGVDASTVYRWIRIYSSSGGHTSSLLPVRRTGGKGESRLSDETERIMGVAIDQFYLSKKQPSVIATAMEVQRLCRDAGVTPPHANTVRNRIKQMTEKHRMKKRAHAKEASDRFEPRPGEFDAASRPLSLVQIDHTLLNVILVDEEDRQSVGRPWLTLACDVYSRMIVGFYVSLDPPGAASVGLCLSHAILPKETWLSKRGIEHSWPCWGVPAIVHTDNGRDFRGKMLQRACNEYNIELDFRALARPHYGAHIERLMGTLSTALETLDGKTFASPKQRGDYDSDAKATMTLVEFERWLAEYITGVYHQKLHTGIGESPARRWENGIFGKKGEVAPRGLPHRPSGEDEYRIRLDFMPYVERTIQQYGVQIDDVFYYSDVLRPYVGVRSKNGPRSFVFKRDPRDISVVHFFDPNIQRYAEVPYRNSSHPPISLWELRSIRKRLADQGKANIDEVAIFTSYQRLREQQERSATITKRVRREKERRKSHGLREQQPSDREAASTFCLPDKIEPFEVVDV
jgi:putative transposase